MQAEPSGTAPVLTEESVTSGTPVRVYMVYYNGGNGRVFQAAQFTSLYFASEYAARLNGFVVALPIVADYRRA